MVCGWTSLQAAKVDTVWVNSPKMGRNIRTVIVSPDHIEGNGAAVIYLLHGHGGEEKTWIEMKPELKTYADRENLIFVCPNGESSWYWDSPLNPTSQFETFVSRELVSFVDRSYRTQLRREKRAIAGLSMGGHGAMWLSFRHKDVFGAAGSMSGGLDIRPFPDNWNMKDQIGAEDSIRHNWDDYTVINQIGKIKNGDLQLIIDCGYDDFFFGVNNAFNQKLLEKGIMHDFIVRPGGHTEEYWSNSIDYQILFFLKYFKSHDKHEAAD
ncbi:MAG: esterase family protein [Paraprevotella sp.]|nr:esterase family protein [Paraprevotella sp.]